MRLSVLLRLSLASTLAVAGCTGDGEIAVSSTDECLLRPEERVEIATAISAAVEADPTLKRVRAFLAEHKEAMGSRPPDQVASAFVFKFGGWVSGPTVSTEQNLLVFDEHWSLSGTVGDPVLGEDIELMYDGEPVISYSGSGDPAYGTSFAFTADGWSFGKNVYSGMDCYTAGQATAQVPGLYATRSWCKNLEGRPNVFTIRVATGDVRFSATIRETGLIASPHYGEPPTASVIYQGKARWVTSSPACLPFDEEINDLIPNYGTLFELSKFSYVLAYSARW